MIEIHRNGTGKPVIGIGDIIKIVILLGGIVVFYFTDKVPTVRSLENHETRITNNEKINDRQTGRLDKLQDTKADKQP